MLFKSLPYETKAAPIVYPIRMNSAFQVSSVLSTLCVTLVEEHYHFLPLINPVKRCIKLTVDQYKDATPLQPMFPVYLSC